MRLNPTSIIGLAIFIGIVFTIKAEDIKLNSNPKAIASHKSGSLIAYGGYNKVTLIDGKTRKQVKVIEPEESIGGSIENMIFVGDVLVASTDDNLLIYDVKKDKIIKIIKYKASSYSFSVTPEKEIAYVNIYKEGIDGYNLKTGEKVFEYACKDPVRSSISPDGKTLVIYSRDQEEVIVVNTETKEKNKLSLDIRGINAFIAAPDNKSFYMLPVFAPLQQVSFKGKILKKIKKSEFYPQTMSLSQDNKYLIIPMGMTPTPEKEVMICDLKKNEIVKRIKVDLGKGGCFKKAIMLPDNKTILALTNKQNKKIMVLDFDK